MSQEVKEMFNRISKKYDTMNGLITFGMHKSWKAQMLKIAQEKFSTGKCLDIACGTGDIAIAFARAGYTQYALDFSSKMLAVSKEKSKGISNIEYIEADAMNLPYSDNSFEVVTCGYGIRNISDTLKGLDEMGRVLKSGGLLIILETGVPNGDIAPLANIYMKYVVPIMGKMLTGDNSAYSYLPDTARKFPYGEAFTKLISQTGRFGESKVIRLNFGASYIYVSTKV